MHVFFIDELPVNRGGKYVHYKHRKINIGSWEYCDIRQYIGQHQDLWLNDVEQWHSDLSRTILQYTKWWWLLSASRLIAWYPPILKSFFFTIALIEYCDTIHNGEIYVVACPVEVYNYLKELRPEYRISFYEDIAGRTQFYKKILSIYKGCKEIFTKKIRMFLRHLDNVKSLLLLTLQYLLKNRAPFFLKNVEVIICSIALLDVHTLVKNGDHYFGKIFDDIPGLDKKNILWLYLSGSKIKRKATYQYRQTKGDNVIFLPDLLTFKDIIRIFSTCSLIIYKLKSVRKELPLLRVAQYKSRIFSEIFFTELLQNVMPITELSVYFAMQRLFKHSDTRIIIYPYEEKGTERAIIYACKNSINKKITAIGFAHVVYNKGHLYLRNRRISLSNPPRPDIIATSGPSMRQWLIDWAKIEPERIKIIGSPRYQHQVIWKRKFQDYRYRLRILVIISWGYEVHILANYLEEVADLFEGCEIVIRPYPYAWDSQEAERGFYRLRRLLNNNLRIEGGSLAEQFSWCDVVIYSSTSAGIEAMLSGRLAIYVELHDIFVLDPLIGKGDLSQTYRCFTPMQLKVLLQQIRQMNEQEYLMSVKKQLEFAKGIYASIDINNLRQLIFSCL